MQLQNALKDITATTLGSLQKKLEARLRGSTSLADASQRFISFVYEEFAGSVVLARLYATIPFASLPIHDREFVRSLVPDAAKRIAPTTLVMSLLGTRGAAAEWNDRASSKGHLGIPLIDTAFIETIPMVARMLSELGIDLKLFDIPNIDTRRFIGGINGLFYVADARDALDAKGRRIIPAEAFVQQNGIRTVFGMGGSYMGGEVAVAIFFCKELLDRETAERFALLIHQFKLSTTQLVGFGKLFD